MSALPTDAALVEMEPRTVAIIGASRRRGTVGAEIVRSILSGAFEGAVYAVNPHSAGTDLHGVPCVATLADLPEPPDLVVITVPAGSVVPVAAACGRFGTSALAVISAGLTADQGRGLLAVCREYGMRLVEPNSLGSPTPK
ncbi:CoA-binding protein [Actinomadura madurae]|uniref:CoA-binding protein n=1 Tax=Actinomadura madurae TaxID=1993 RepID=UPI0015EF23FD|nr:CoA-binding protein [Actinomadura madurae]